MTGQVHHAARHVELGIWRRQRRMTTQGETGNIKQRPRPSEQPYRPVCSSDVPYVGRAAQTVIVCVCARDGISTFPCARRLRQSVALFMPSPLLISSSCHCDARCGGPP
eukprot:scaffold85178_cov19-Prasinocladus_malaysianus.AAC.1